MSVDGTFGPLNKPIVGVFVFPKQIKKLNKQKPHYKYVELSKANLTAQTTLYFFCQRDVDDELDKIKGTYFDAEEGKWKQRYFPFPDVLYRRTDSLNRPKYVKLRQKINEYGIKPLNYLEGFNKWDVYQHLSQDSSVSSYVPKAILFKDQDDLKKMLDRYDSIYVKPRRGGRGRGVMRITKLGQDNFETRSFARQTVIRRGKTLAELAEQIREAYKGRKVIVQQGLDLIEYKNRIADVRAEVQRNGKGKLEIVGITVRLGRKDSPISTHGSSFPFEYFFKKRLGYSKPALLALKREVTQCLVKIYQAVEKVYGPSGEIGIDLGLDKNGKLWFIECNSRSRKVSLRKAYDIQAVRRSSLYLLEYAKFIADKK
ncbi:hypothetical protein J2S00_000220 [Caldalkalibacillus uzonensis]|uniref:ATP-grasp domain-containing protein n=1 Tax=Caldalkalibacillus uzonensis TaxID=353224 RepID=A0ABU0CM07_9BACI|nr:YheC/YheD family protein [Caldalkalibacillus uzonensis]MDQ0337450.1 hypothetical protein [Caldalkalibacillus uzonensis]